LKTPCFPEISTAAFGGRRRRTQDLIVDKKRALLRDGLLDRCGLTEPFIPAELLEPPETGPHSRRRIYPLSLSFHAMLHQSLKPRTSSAEMVKQIQAACLHNGLSVPSSSTGAYSQACGKVNESWLEELFEQSVARTQRMLPSRDWLGHRVRTLDGTSLSMPDTPELQALWPQSNTQRPGCGFPLLQLTGLFDLHQGLLLDYRIGDKHTSERRMADELYERLEPGEVLLADRGFCHWAALAGLNERGVFAVMRLNGSKKWDRRQARRLGKGDWLYHWKRPERPTGGLDRAAWEALPESLPVRIIEADLGVPGFRTQRVVLVTTLLDPARYPAGKLVALYGKRWSVELRFREIKTTMGMTVLRSKSPSRIRKEVRMFFIAYNLVRGLIAEAACVNHIEVDRVSFKGAVDQLRAWTPAVVGTRRGARTWEKLRREYLNRLVDSPVLKRPQRSEPRARKRRAKCYQLLNKPRQEMRQHAQPNTTCLPLN
jgi:hypothetical protein